MKDIIEIAEMMQGKIKALEQGRKLIAERGNDKATAISNYEKVFAITILRIKHDDITEFEGHEIDSKLPANLIEKIAKGICWAEKLEVEKCEALYKAGVVGMSALMSELNALQSINRYLDTGGK